MPTGVHERPAGIPTCFALDQNYPNPFNRTTVIRYQMPVASDMQLTVYDVIVGEVTVSVNEERAPGKHEVSFDASTLASGVSRDL